MRSMRTSRSSSFSISATWRRTPTTGRSGWPRFGERTGAAPGVGLSGFRRTARRPRSYGCRFTRPIPLRPDAPPEKIDPRGDLAELHFDAIKIRTMRGDAAADSQSPARGRGLPRQPSVWIRTNSVPPSKRSAPTGSCKSPGPPCRRESSSTKSAAGGMARAGRGRRISTGSTGKSAKDRLDRAEGVGRRRVASRGSGGQRPSPRARGGRHGGAIAVQTNWNAWRKSETRSFSRVCKGS